MIMIKHLEKSLLALILLSVPSIAIAAPVTVFLIGLGLSAAAASAVISVGLSIALSLISRVLFKPKGANPNADTIGRSQIVRSPVAPRRVIYGKVKTSGVLVFAATAGERNKYLHMIIVLAGYFWITIVAHHHDCPHDHPIAALLFLGEGYHAIPSCKPTPSDPR